MILADLGNQVSVRVLMPCPLEPRRKYLAGVRIADRIKPEKHFAGLGEDMRRYAWFGLADLRLKPSQRDQASIDQTTRRRQRHPSADHRSGSRAVSAGPPVSPVGFWGIRPSRASRDRIAIALRPCAFAIWSIGALGAYPATSRDSSSVSHFVCDR